MARLVLELRWAGRTFDSGEQLLDQAWEQSVSIASGSGAETASFPVTLDLGVNVAALVAQGYDLSQAEGTLTLDGVVVLEGRAVAPVYGDPGEPAGIVRLTLQQSVIDDTSLWPPAGLVVDTETWPNAPGDSLGRVYPQVWGAPGADLCAGSPGLLVENAIFSLHQYLLIHGASAGAVSSVRVISVGTATAASFTVLNTTDGRGQQVALVDLQEGGGLFGTAVDGDEFWVMWNSGGPRSGLAGDVVSDQLSLMSIRADLGRLAAAAAQLNSYSLAFCISERVNLREWVAARLTDILPMSLVRDQGGLYPAVWRASVTTEDAVAHLTVGLPDCQALGGIGYSGDPLNSCTVRYQVRGDTGDHLAVTTADQDNSYYAAVSRDRYHGDAHDGRWEREISTDIVYDIATGERIAHELVRRFALRRRQLEVWLDRRVWGRLRPGDLVTITETARSLSSQLAWIEQRRDDEDGMTMLLTFQEDPAL